MSINETTKPLKTKNQPPPVRYLDDLHDVSRWVTWREDLRGGKPTKIPFNAETGKRAASDDPSTWRTCNEARHRWRKMKRADADAVGGVGIVLGNLGDGTHLMGIDLDRCIKSQSATLSPWADEIVERFSTYTERSPSGKGVKLFFLVAAKGESAVADLIDGKTRKAFVAGAHREIALDRSRYYTVTGDSLNGDALRTVELSDVQWLLDDAGPRFLQKYKPEDDKANRDESGSGHGFRFLAECKRDGMDYEEAEEAIRADNTLAGEWARRKDDRAIRRAWDKATTKHGHTWEEPDVSLLDDRRGELPEFPLEALSPPWLREWVERAAHGAGTTIDHVAMPLLGIASGLIGTSRRVKASKSWSQPLTLWTCLVGYSGDGKTPGIKAIKGPLDEVEEAHKDEIDELRRAHEVRVEAAKAARAEWKAAFEAATERHKAPLPKPAEADEPPAFIVPRLYVADTTIERMALLLQARPQGMLLIADELAGWFLNMSRYSGGQDNQFWLMAWDGNSHVTERMGRPPIELDHLLVGIVGGLQPDKIGECFKGAADGMYARFLMAWPDKAPYRPLTDEVEEVDRDIVEMLDRLAHLEERAHRRVPLSDRARAAFERLRKTAHSEAETLSGREREWWAKMTPQVLRLAGVLSYIAWALDSDSDREPKEIRLMYVEAAKRLVLDYFWPHSKACLRQIGLTRRHSDARQVLQWIKAKGQSQIGREEVRRKALSQRLDADETENLLKHLVQAGWLRRITGETTRRRGRPAVRWEVNPKITGMDG